MNRRIAVLLSAALTLFAAAPVAQAQYRVEFSYCDRLQAQYRGALEQARGSDVSGRSMVEMSRISRELAQAQMAARQYNCTGGFLFFGPRPSPSCPAIMGQINRLSRQLSQLRGTNFGYLGYSPEMEVARLREELDNAGCGIPGYGGTRTLCVRSCDGYYFPIEFQATSSRIDTDAAVCQSMYSRDGQAELFVQNSDDVADATSVTTGQRYGDRSYAFRYRDTYQSQCVAELQDGIRALAERYRSASPAARRVAARQSRTPVPVPLLRPPASEDPETLVNLAGRFTVKPVAPQVAVAAAGDAPMTPVPPRSVRMVGPAYYADLFDLSKVRDEQAKLKEPAPPPRFTLVSPASASEKGKAEPAVATPERRRPIIHFDD